MARVEQGHLAVMVNVCLVAFITDDAIDFVSDGPELGLLWCFFFHAIRVSEMRWKSRDFLDLYDLAVIGEIHVQGFFNLMGYPTDAPSLNFNGNRMVDSGAIFEDYAYAICVFLFHAINLSELR